MKIISLRIENYGKLNKVQVDFTDGLNVICKENGFGKSTLCSFIRAMFYGLPTTAVNGKDYGDREKYYPFSGGKFGGSLTFSHNGKVYTVERFFDVKSQVKDTFKVYSENGERVDFDKNLGKEVFNLSESGFLRTLYVDDLIKDVNEEREERLENLILGVKSESVKSAIDKLDALSKKYKPHKNGGASLSDATQDKIRDNLKELENYENVRISMEREIERQSELKNEIKSLEDGFIKDGKELTGKRKAIVWLSLITCILSLLSGVICIGSNLALSVCMFTVAVVSGIAFGGSVFGKNKNKEYRDDKLTKLNSELSTVTAKISLMEENLEGEKLIKESTAKLTEEFASYKRKYEMLVKASEFLTLADKDMKSGYLLPVKSAYVNMVKSSKKEFTTDVFLTDEMEVRYIAGGEIRSDKHLSSGEKSFSALAERLAFIEVLYGNDKPFIIMDDPFVYMDKESTERVIPLVKKMSEDTQILYLCCHESRIIR